MTSISSSFLSRSDLLPSESSFNQGYDNSLLDQSLSRLLDQSGSSDLFRASDSFSFGSKDLNSSRRYPTSSLNPASMPFRPGFPAPSSLKESSQSLNLSFLSLPPPPTSNTAPPAPMLSSTLSSPERQFLFRSPLITSPPPLPQMNVAERISISGFNQSLTSGPDVFNSSQLSNLIFGPRKEESQIWHQPQQQQHSKQKQHQQHQDNPIVNSLIGLTGFSDKDKIVAKEAKQWTHRELVSTVLKDLTITVQWLTDRRLLVGSRSCPRCGPLVRLDMARCQRTRHWQTYDELVWLCHNCDHSTYLRQGSFFDRPFNVSLITYVEMIYWWARCMPIDQIAEQTRTRQNFVTLMMCLLREVCAFEVGERHMIEGGLGADIQLNPQRGHFTLNKVSCEDYMTALEPVEAKWRLKFGFNAFECILVHLTNMYKCEARR